MRIVVRLLGAEVLAIGVDRTPPAAPPMTGLTEDGAPKRHETHTAATTQIGFQTRRAGWFS